MDSTIDNDNGDSTPQSVQASWQHCKEVWSASSSSEAWASFKKMMEALPPWALVVTVIGVFALMTNAWIILVPLAAGGFLTAMYFTVKHAIRAALREHDAEQRR